MNLPSGTLTFLFTDIEGSTKLWEQHPEAMRLALVRHDELLREAITTHDGYVFKTVGDAFCAAFSKALNAVEAAIDIHLVLLKQEWGETGSVRVRIGLHTGEAEERDNDYFGQSLNRVARLQSVGYGQQTLLSLTTFQLVRDNLPPLVSIVDLGNHRLKDLQRPEQIFQLLHPALPAEFPPLKSLDNPSLPNNLPQQLTSFVGRSRELLEVKTLLTDTRMLTLLGIGGTGKTRLALQASADRLDGEGDGVWFVELAALNDPVLVPQAVSQVLGVTEHPGMTVTQCLVDYLKTRRLLLFLDNCEHLIEPCAKLTETLLKNCPLVKILATSREALGIGGEQIYRLSTLSLPESPHQSTAESLMSCEAVQLFVERAVAVQPSFTVTNENAPSLARVCVRLDGIPLALELAAARMRSLSIQEIDSRLNSRFRLLTGGSRTALPRQQTLRALIDWSYDLLGDQEKALLGRLSVFAGGWDLEAAEAIGTGRGSEDWEVMDLLTALVDKSLVAALQEGERTRYRLLETVREYANERLASPERHALQQQHAIYYLMLAEQAEPELMRAGQSEWLRHLDKEHDNFRAVLQWSLEAGEGTETGLRLASALVRYWCLRNHMREGRTWLDSLLNRPSAANPTRIRAKALNAAGMLANYLGDFSAAHTHNQACLALRRSLNDRAGIGASLNNLGNLASDQGDYPAARQLFEEALQIWEEMNDKINATLTLNNLANVVWTTDIGEARAMHEKGLALKREIGNPSAIVLSLGNLGSLAVEQGDLSAARRFLREGLMLLRELGDKRLTAICLEGLAALAQAREQSVAAVQLLSMAAAMRQSNESPKPPGEQEAYQHSLSNLQDTLGPVGFQTAWSETQYFTWEQAIDYALSLPLEEA